MSLAPLYLKAAVGAVGPRARELPGTVLTRDGVRVDRAHLARYARVCGFGLADRLPATYPHVLAFPLQVELMAGRSFPLPLPGLVHIANDITVHRPIDAGEVLDVAVRAERFVEHPKGARVDLVAAITAGGEPVWDGRSTYLGRGARAPAPTTDAGPPGVGAGTAAGDGAGPVDGTGLDDGAPPDIGAGAPVATWTVDGGTGRRYAGVSGDVNPIHLHPLAARAFGFPRAIAHGMWTAARALAALEGRLPGALDYRVGFGRPLLLPSTAQLRTRAADGGWDLDVRSRDRRHLWGTVRTRTCPAPGGPA